MPWGDGTGPWGLGPRTGRAAGFCAGYGIPGFMNRAVFPPFGGRWLSLYPRYPLYARYGWGRAFGYRRFGRRRRW